MKTAIPMLNGLFCSHFSRASDLLFIDSEGHHLGTLNLGQDNNPNPCNKKQWIDWLKQHEIDRVFVKHIGEPMLNRLLAANFRVERLTKLPLVRTNLHLLHGTAMQLGDAHVAKKHLQKSTCKHGDCDSECGTCGCKH